MLVGFFKVLLTRHLYANIGIDTYYMKTISLSAILFLNEFSLVYSHINHCWLYITKSGLY